MKWTGLIVFLVTSGVTAKLSDRIESDNPVNGNLVLAVNQIILEIFVPQYPTVNLIYAVEEGSFPRSQSILTEIVRKNGGKSLFTLNDCRNIGKVESSAIQASVVLLDSIESFRKFNEKVTTKLFVFSGHFLFLLVDGKKSEHDEIFSTLWVKNIYNLNLIYDDGKVETFSLFRKNGTCGETKPVLVNRFIGGEFQNGLESVFPGKLKNLQNCSIRFVTFAETFSVKIINSTDGSYKLTGYDIEIMEALASSLNFHVQLTFLESVAVPWGSFSRGGLSSKIYQNAVFPGIVYPNGTVTNALGEIFHQRADVVIGNFFLEKTRMKVFDSSIAYHSFPLVFVVPPGR